MWKQKVAPPTEGECRKLKAARRQLETVRSVRQKCNEIVSAHKTVKAQTFDGMPHSRRLPVGMDGSASQAEELLAMLEREERKLKQCCAEAKRIIDRLPEELEGFCSYYYLQGMSVQNTAWMMGRSERTAWTYKAFIEQKARKAAGAGG